MTKKKKQPDPMQEYEDMVAFKGCPECGACITYESKATINGQDNVQVCICDDCGEVLVKPPLYRLEYSFEPRFEDKMLKLFEKFHLEWTHADWIDGEKQGSLIGGKERLIRFQQAKSGQSGMSRHEAEAMIVKVKK
jgi:hypothetical protein